MTQVEIPSVDSGLVAVRQGCHILDLDVMRRADIEELLDTVDSMQEILSRDIKQVPILRGKTVVHLFIDAPSQTHLAFELAAHALSAHVMTFSPQSSQLAECSTFVNTVRVLQSLGVDVLVIGHTQAGAPYLAARHFQGALINAGDGFHADPVQALQDLYMIRDKLGQVEQVRVVLVGDILHSRSARSLLWGLTHMGAQITLCAPPTLIGPVRFWQATWPGVRVVTSLDAALQEVDVVMLLPLANTPVATGLAPSLREYRHNFTLTAERLERLSEHVLIMHSGSLHDSIAITPELIAAKHSIFHEQVASGVAVRMAILYRLAGGDCQDE